MHKFKKKNGKRKEKKVEGGKITQTEWARELGVSKQYVCYLVKKGIVELEDGVLNKT
ncbi:hypothetical protein wCauATS_11430 [Wolbachia pipientis]|nr:hypothetical protein wHmb_02080 [Wolbachia pipientis]GKS79689.1 hypothetical protein wHmb_05750 [Wolbachia pipientis]